MTAIYAISFFICGVMTALMIAGIVVSAFIPDVKNWNRKFFVTLFTILTLLVTSYFADLFASMYSTAVIAERISVFLNIF